MDQEDTITKLARIAEQLKEQAASSGAACDRHPGNDLGLGEVIRESMKQAQDQKEILQGPDETLQEREAILQGQKEILRELEGRQQTRQERRPLTPEREQELRVLEQQARSVEKKIDR